MTQMKVEESVIFDNVGEAENFIAALRGRQAQILWGARAIRDMNEFSACERLANSVRQELRKLGKAAASGFRIPLRDGVETIVASRFHHLKPANDEALLLSA